MLGSTFRCVVLGSTLCLVGPSLAQAPPAEDLHPPAAGPASTALPRPAGANFPAEASPAPTGADRDAPSPPRSAVGDLIAGCRDKVRQQQTRGKERRADIISCVRAGDPRAADTMQCRDAARENNLAGAELKRSVRLCLRKAGGTSGGPQ